MILDKPHIVNILTQYRYQEETHNFGIILEAKIPTSSHLPKGFKLIT